MREALKNIKKLHQNLTILQKILTTEDAKLARKLRDNNKLQEIWRLWQSCQEKQH